MAYLKPKLEAVKLSGNRVWAEMGTLNGDFTGPCVLLAQGDKDNLVAVVLAQVEGDSISRLDMCIVPTPQSAVRSGNYPIDWKEHEPSVSSVPNSLEVRREFFKKVQTQEMLLEEKHRSFCADKAVAVYGTF
jgi:hypothetical protein